MANKFETATNNYGNNFSNNNGNHHYTTYGHKYDDSAYVLAKFNGQVDPVAISSTGNGYPSNNVTTYGQGYIVTLKGHTHVDDYTQTITLGWPSNINTKGKIEGTLSFSVDKTSVPASGGTVNIHFPDLKYTGTRDTRGYRYTNVTLKPEVPSNPDTLDDDGTAFSNSTVESTTYFGENRQGFLNYEEPKMDYVIYSSYGNKGDNPFYLCADTKLYNGADSKTGATGKAWNISSPVAITNTYMHMYDNLNTIFSYAYAPYHDEVKNSFGAREGVGWTHNNARLEVADNFLSTFNKKLTMSYQNSYWTISYDGVSNMPFIAAFEYMGTYRGVTSSTDIDTNLTSYDRSTVLHNFFPSIANSSTTPSYVATSYTISQPKATLTPSYLWSLPETAGTGASNFDTKTGAKYVSIIGENNYLASTNGTKGLVTVAKQGHYMGYVTGNLDNTLATSASNRTITMDHGTSKEGTIGNLKWTDCENRTERFFNVRVSTKYDNCRNQNITSITNEYSYDDKRKPEVTLKCRQLPAHWNHPGIHISIKSSRYVIPSDSRFDNINPTVGISTTSGWSGGTTTTYFSAGLTNGTNRIGWTISPHNHHLISTIDNNNSKLLLRIYMPTVSTPYIKSTVSGSISASASTTYVGPIKSDITITPTWSVPYTRGYDKGFDAAEWKYSFVGVEGYNDDPNSYGGDGMDCSGVTGFNDFIVHLNKCADFNYRYPSVTLTASSSNSPFTLNTTTNSASDATSLVDGAKSSGFTVSVPANPKKGSTWYGAVTTEPTETRRGIVSVSPGTLMNSTSRSTTISFSNSFNTDLTSGSITNPDSITITQGPDKWGGSDDFYYCIDVAEDGTHNPALITSFLGLCVTYRYKTFSNDSAFIVIPNYTNNTYDIGTLRPKHQLEIIGIGSIASKDYSTTAGTSSYSVNYSGYPDEEDENDFTYVSVVHLYCDGYKSIGVTEGPNGTPSRVLKTWIVTPKATDYKVQYQLNNGAWQDGRSLAIGTNYGSTTAASCVSNDKTGDDVKSGAFNYTPEEYSGSTTKYHKFKVRVVDNTDPNSTAFENPTQYTITQSGVSASTTSRTFTFKTGGTRCTTSTPSSVSGQTSQNNVGSFTVTPNSDPFYNYTSYTNGMVVNSFKINTFKEEITSDNSLSATHSGNVDFQSGTTIDFWFGIAGSTSDYIIWSRQGSVKYKFYYDYWVQCYNSNNTMVSGKESGTLQSSEITSTPSANATKYYKRRLVDGSWSTSLTIRITSTGTYSVTGGWATESGSEYSSTKRETFSITVRTWTPGTEYKYQIPTGTKKMSLSFTDSSGQAISSPVQLESTDESYRVNANGPSVYIQVSSRTYRHFNTGDNESYSEWSDWSDTSTKAYTISPSYEDFSPTEGDSETKKFTLTVATKYGDYDVTTNGATGDSQSFTVSKKSGDATEYRTYCTMTVKDAYITAFDTSGTTSCEFTTDIQYKVTNNGTIIKDWTSTGNADTSVTINASSKELTPTSMGSSATTYSSTSYTFTLSGTAYDLVGTTSDVGYVYKYGKTYYNS